VVKVNIKKVKSKIFGTDGVVNMKKATIAHNLHYLYQLLFFSIVF
jgi:hypothetical protein